MKSFAFLSLCKCTLDYFCIVNLQSREMVRVRGSTPDSKRRSLIHTGSSSALTKATEISALEIGAEQVIKFSLKATVIISVE